MLKSICTMLINDSSISIEFTENKIAVTVEISESHSLWSYLFKQMFDMAPILLYHALKTTTPFMMLLSINDCDSSCQALTITCFSSATDVKLRTFVIIYCVQHKILQKFTNFHAIRSWSFQNICNETRWPHFFAPPCSLSKVTLNIEHYYIVPCHFVSK